MFKSKKVEKYTPEEALNEASKLKEKIKTGEAENYDEAEEKVEQEKRNLIEYPEKMKGLHPIDGTENKTISFARVGGRERWYTTEDGREADGDSLYAKISREAGDEYFLIDGKNINDVGNYSVGFFNDVNKEIEIEGKKYPMAVYLKTRDKISPHKTDHISDVDVIKQQTYKFCFYDEEIDNFITVDMENYGVLRGEIVNWANVKQNGDTIIIDRPKRDVYDDGHKITERGGPIKFSIKSLINTGRLEESKKLLDNNDFNKAKQIAQKTIQSIIDDTETFKTFSNKQIDNFLEICQEFNLNQEASELASGLFNKVIGNSVDYRTIDSNILKLNWLLGLIKNKKEEYHKLLSDYKSRYFYQLLENGYGGSAIEFAKEENINIDINNPEVRKKIEEGLKKEIKEYDQTWSAHSLFSCVERFLNLGIDPQIIKQTIEKNSYNNTIPETFIHAIIYRYHLIDYFHPTINKLNDEEKEERTNSYFGSQENLAKVEDEVKKYFIISERLGTNKKEIISHIEEMKKYYGKETIDKIIDFIN